MKRILGLSLTMLIFSAGCSDLCFTDDCIDVCNGGECSGYSSCSTYGDNTNGDCYCVDGDCDPNGRPPPIPASCRAISCKRSRGTIVEARRST